VADDHLRETLPPIIHAAFSILPHLLAVQIMIQNTLLAQYYTTLHNYCDEAGFPSPPPPMDDVVATWERDFKPVQKEVESINCIARGRAVHQSMSLGDDASRKNSSITGLNVRNGFANRRASSQGIATSPNPQARVMRIPSSNSLTIPSPSAPEPSPSPEPDYSSHLTPASSYSSYAPAGPTGDYFQRGVGQKKKPPPPPPKRIESQSSGLFAVALYAFAGEGQGDLNFREGDRIKVIKKTDSTDDWWQGELNGVQGSFPANYCKLS
jgi:amphiphysin